MAIKGRTGMTAIVNFFADDDNRRMEGALFQFPFYGVNYRLTPLWNNTDSCFSSNSWVSFGMIPTDLYLDSYTKIRGVLINHNDRHYRWFGYQSTNDFYRLRWEGGTEWEGSSPPYEWELTLFRDGVMQLDFNPMSLTSVDGTNWITNGVNDSTALSYNLNTGAIQTIRFKPKRFPTQGYDVTYNASEYSIGGGDVSPPVVNIISVSRSKISDETGVDRAEVKFTFNTNVTAWTVNVMGASYNTGTVAHSGGAVIANTEIIAEINYTELYQEGSNKINIYGQNSMGWTPYEA